MGMPPTVPIESMTVSMRDEPVVVRVTMRKGEDKRCGVPLLCVFCQDSWAELLPMFVRVGTPPGAKAIMKYGGTPKLAKGDVKGDDDSTKTGRVWHSAKLWPENCKPY